MKIYRAMSIKEKQALINTGSILFPHKTCIREDWILNPHPEDYQTGKFFFFTMEDAFLYIKETKLKNDNEVAILEMDINNNLVLKYISYGIYYEGDYDFFGHAVPELLLPYNVVQQKIKLKEFNLICFSKDTFSYTNNKFTFNLSYKKSKPKNFVNFVKILEGLISNRNSKNSQIKYDEYQSKFNESFKDFMECQQHYTYKYSKNLTKTFNGIKDSQSLEM